MINQTIHVNIIMQTYVCKSIVIKIESILEFQQHLRLSRYSRGVYHPVTIPIIYRYGDVYRVAQPASTWDPDIRLHKLEKIYCYLLPDDINKEEIETIVSYFRKIKAARSDLSGTESVNFIYQDKKTSSKLCNSYGYPSFSVPPTSLIKKFLGENAPSPRTIARIKKYNGLSKKIPEIHSWNNTAKKQKPPIPSFEEIVNSYPKDQREEIHIRIINELNKGRTPVEIYREIQQHDMFNPDHL